MNLEEKDRAAAAVAKAPRISLAYIEASIEFRHVCNGLDWTPANLQLSRTSAESLASLTIAIVVLKNGFVFVGKSAPAATANYDRALGEKFAYQDALSQIWPYMGFALREQLAASEAASEAKTIT